jgi:hypothetical protein
MCIRGILCPKIRIPIECRSKRLLILGYTNLAKLSYHRYRAQLRSLHNMGTFIGRLGVTNCIYQPLGLASRRTRRHKNEECDAYRLPFHLYSILRVYLAHSKPDCHRPDWCFEGSNPLRLRPIFPYLSANFTPALTSHGPRRIMQQYCPRLAALKSIPGT